MCNKEIEKLSGDGRSDSPGHNAKYGTYTCMDRKNGKVAEFSLVQVTEISSSNAMEKEGFVRCLNSLEDSEVTFNTVATNRLSITSTTEKKTTVISNISVTYGTCPKTW